MPPLFLRSCGESIFGVSKMLKREARLFIGVSKFDRRKSCWASFPPDKVVEHHRRAQKPSA